MNPLAEQCLRYLDGDLSEHETREFTQLIAESPEAAKTLARYLIDEHYFAKIQPTKTSGRIEAADGSALGLAISRIERQDETDDVLRELLRLEREAAVVPYSNEHLPAKQQSSQENQERLTWSQVAGATGYLLASATKSRSAKSLAAIAAVVLLAATLLVISLISNGNDTPTAVTHGPDNNSDTAPPQRTVATLTAQHKALWQAASGVSMPTVGENLLPGQRLALAEGLAEITTARGVKVTLEAPCEIEFSEDENALRLVGGQLYAVVPSQATGFAVQTPTAHIVDLGTEFGVEVGADMATRLQVYTGEVRAAPIDDEGVVGDWVSYYSAQAVSINPDTGVQEIAFDPGRHEHDITTVEMRPKPEKGEMWWRGDVSKHKQTGREKSGAIQVFLERTGVVLDEETPVDLNWPGRWLPGDGKQPASVQAGERVDVYLVHFDPAGSNGFDQKGEFSIRFKGRILGVICDSQSLAQAPDSLRSQTRYPELDKCKSGPGLDWELGDQVRIHRNKGALEMKLAAASCYDQMLVLVESKEIPEAINAP
ncbi:MAG: FecR family protein [Phycisphaeraceae bacterium]|nr:FecR family protein [Phycisphaeraceae bacterium]